MHPTHSFLPFAVYLTSLASVATATSWPRWLPEVDALVQRADDSPSDAPGQTSLPSLLPYVTSFCAKAKLATRTSSSSDSGATIVTSRNADSSAPRVTADLNTAKPTESGKSKTETGTGKSTKVGKPKASHTQFPPDSPPGGVNILTPATSAEPTVLYKIRDHVTLGWNYTSLQGTPTAIDVLVSCSVASQPWTLTGNMSFATSVNYVWDTNEQADSVETPLLTQLYTLIIKDSDAQISDPPQPGYLGTYSGFIFGLYSPQPYTPYSDWTCPGCNDGSSLLDRQALWLAVFMSVITFFSFTWFVSGLGLH